MSASKAAWPQLHGTFLVHIIQIVPLWSWLIEGSPSPYVETLVMVDSPVQVTPSLVVLVSICFLAPPCLSPAHAIHIFPSTVRVIDGVASLLGWVVSLCSDCQLVPL